MRSMIRLNRMMLTPNGQIPAPANSPAVTLSNPKSVINLSPQRYMRLKKAYDVVTRAMKQPQNMILSCRLIIWFLWGITS
jgi:hypothetical protein